MSKELISEIDNHFTNVENWIGSKKAGSGISLSVNKTIIPIEYKKKVEEFNSENSISDLIKFGFIENVTIEIYRIISEYLAINIKSKSINTSAGISIIFEYITEECSNLELQEINFIFKSGVMGKFGVIYNDISIDTICGKDGWFETYYKEYRKLRPEPTKKEDARMSGKEMTEPEFLEKYPEYKDQIRLRDLLLMAKSFKITTKEAKEFYLIKELTLNDFKDDCEIYSGQYHRLPENEKKCFTETQFLNNCHCSFIIQNFNKVKG